MEKLRTSGTPWWRLVAIGLVMAGFSLVAREGLAAPPADVFRALKASCAVSPGLPAGLRVVPTRVAAHGRHRPSRQPAPPPPAAEPPATAMPAFFTCPTVAMPVLRVGRGMVAVGPRLRA